ncbi:MAG: hypothetical protein ACYS0D_00125 [Planctomycetota bacterium]|jgi:hypothetical protein
MNSLDRAIQRARRRATADLILRRAGAGLAFGALAGLGLLGLDRLLGAGLSWTAFAALLAGGLVLGVLRAWAQRPARLPVAVRLDRTLGLKDRIGTAEAIRRGVPAAREPFAAMARRDAERVAETIDVRAASPIRVTRVWVLAVAASAALVAGSIYLPRADARGRGPDPQQRAAEEAQRTRIIEAIDQAVAEAERTDTDEQSSDDLEALERLAEQLDDATTPELAEARDESAARLEEMAERMARESERNLRVLEETARRFGSVTPPEAPPDAPLEAAEFADALRRGDLEEAADRFDEMIDQGASEEAQERAESIAEQLRSLAEQIEETTSGDKTPDDEQLQRALEDLGLDEETLDEALEDPDAAPDPEALRRLAKDLERERRERELAQEADERARELARALEETADALEQPETPAEPPPPAPPEETADQPQEQPRAEPGERPDDQQQEQQQQQERPTPGEQREQPAQPRQTGEQQEQVTEQREEPGAEPREVPQPAPGESPQQQPRPQPPPGEAQQPQKVPRPAETEGAPPSEAERQRALRRVSRLLREMERAREEGREQREVSERLREAARELADTLSDEEKEQLARQWLGRQRGPATEGEGVEGVGEPEGIPGARFEDLDLRGTDSPDLTISQWLTDEPGADPGAATARATAVGRAQRAAEQAVEKSVVPSRYHELIQRYFGRLPETADEAAAPSTSDGS